MEIFHNECCPPIFDNWFLDDWISKARGDTRAIVLESWHVEHRSAGSLKTRHKPNTEKAHYLHNEIVKGRKVTQDWFVKERGNSSVSALPKT